MLENYFKKFRDNIIGINDSIITPLGEKKIIYADWTASGRLYKPIEDLLIKEFYPTIANTHTETSETGALTTKSYHHAQSIIKEHVHADENDVLLNTGSGMTGAVNKLQRILGLRVPEQVLPHYKLEGDDRPVVFVTHMEHHSNHTSWLVTLAEVVQIKPTEKGLVDFEDLEKLLIQYSSRKMKIGAFTACTNVTGIRLDYHKFAKLMHKYGGYCFVDFAASAPYVEINMHPENDEERLDAIFFSPHKFLGGPGSSGVLIFNKDLYKNKIPDITGGGTVKWTNRWGEYSFFDEIEIKEDGGTPSFLQTIRTALAIKLKEEMGISNILAREEEIKKLMFDNLKKIDKLFLIAGNIEDRLLVFSFLFDHIHHNLVSKILNDYFGIQGRGGCSCAGTYGHYLFNIDYETSHRITDEIERGELQSKPGWTRLSLHPTTTDDEVLQICNALNYISKNIDKIKENYNCNEKTYEYSHKSNSVDYEKQIQNRFILETKPRTGILKKIFYGK